MKKYLLILVALLFISLSASAGNLVVEGVNYDPAPAFPGEYIKVWIHLKNDSGFQAKDVMFNLDLSGKADRDHDFPFFLETGAEKLQNIGTIEPNKQVVLKYTILVDPNALNGDYRVAFEFGQDGEFDKVKYYTITVLSRNPQIEILDSSVKDAMPGQTIETGLEVMNVGSASAVDVLIGLEEDRTVTSTGIVVEREISPIGSSFSLIDRINAGDTAIAELMLSINPEAELKTYMVPIHIEFKDENSNTYTETRYIGIRVFDAPELEASISDVVPIAFQGGTSNISIDLYNVGVGSAKYVVAEVLTDAGKVQTPKTFIGTMEADDFDSFKTEISIYPDTAPGMHPVKLKLYYRNSYGEEEVTEQELQLKVYSAGEAQAALGVDGLIWIGIISLILELIGLYVVAKFIYRKVFKRGKQ